MIFWRQIWKADSMLLSRKTNMLFCFFIFVSIFHGFIIWNEPWPRIFMWYILHWMTGSHFVNTLLFLIFYGLDMSRGQSDIFILKIKMNILNSVQCFLPEWPFSLWSQRSIRMVTIWDQLILNIIIFLSRW